MTPSPGQPSERQPTGAVTTSNALTWPDVVLSVAAVLSRQPELADQLRLRGLDEGEIRLAIAYHLYGERLKELPVLHLRVGG